MRGIGWALAAVMGSAMAAMAASFSGGNGSGPASAVVISGASNGAEGIAAEYQWIGQHFPGAQVVQQQLVRQGDRAYDLLTLQTRGGQQQVWFDITSFLGH